MNFKEIKILRLLTDVFRVVVRKPRKHAHHNDAKKWPRNDSRDRPVKKAKGSVSTDTTIFNHPRKDFHSN